MSSLEERVALLEGRVQDQGAFIAIVHSTGAELRQAVQELSSELRPQIIGLRTDVATLRADVDGLRADVVSLRIDVDKLRTDLSRENGELRGDMHRGFGEVRAEMDRRFGEVRAEMDRRFSEARLDTHARFDRIERRHVWLMGLAVTTTIASLGSVAGTLAVLLQAAR
jgi:hypothetical protein